MDTKALLKDAKTAIKNKDFQKALRISKVFILLSLLILVFIFINIININIYNHVKFICILHLKIMALIVG